MAINSIRYRRGSVDVGAATKSCAISLLALAGSVREIPDSFFVARRPGKLSLWGTHRGGNERCVLHCSRGGQPALHPANDACDSSDRCIDGSDPTASLVSCSCVALWIAGRYFFLVLLFVASFRGLSSFSFFAVRALTSGVLRVWSTTRATTVTGDAVVN